MLRALPPAGVPLRGSDLCAGAAAGLQGTAAVAALQDDIRRRFGVRHVFPVSSGRGALSYLLQGLKELTPDRTVVALPAYTSFSVPSAVVHAGLKVALYDIDPVTLSPDPASLAAVLDGRTLAVVACHLFGFLADLDPIRDLAGERKIPVIDDAAQAMGADYRGRAAGTCGDAGFFSLSRGKNITAVDGGIVVTGRDELAAALARIPLPDRAARSESLLLKALLLSLLLRPSLYWVPRSLPFLALGASVFEPVFPLARLTPFQAGIARSMLGRLPGITAARRSAARTFCSRLAALPGIDLPQHVTGGEPVYLRFPLVVRGDRPFSEAPSLGIVRSYPAALDAVTPLRPHLVSGVGSCPGARRLAARLLTLPTNQFVSDDDRERIIAFVRGL